MKIEIRKSAWFDDWLWTCPVCHFGMNIPWEKTWDWRSALAESLAHAEEHARVGQRLEWTPIL